MSDTTNRSSCDLCGSPRAARLFDSPRLDGPLARCEECGLVYVAERRGEFVFAAADEQRSRALSSRVAELELVDFEVEQAELPLRRRVERDRLDRLRRHVAGGSLLDVGCSTGEFMKVAAEAFDCHGVEPDPITSEQARQAGLRVVAATLEEVVKPGEGFDAVTMFHVIEHLDSPRRAMQTIAGLLAPGGVVMLETPTTDSLWFRLAATRWRQLLPDHYFFFSRATLERLLSQSGLRMVDCGRYGRRVSLRFLADRARRSRLPLADTASSALKRLNLGERTIYVNPGDIMTAIARRQ